LVKKYENNPLSSTPFWGFLAKKEKGSPMTFPTYLRLFMAIALVVFSAACGGKGEVVKVTAVNEGSYAGLNEEHLAKIDEIKKKRGDRDINNSLKNVIEKTRHFSVAQYLMEHPGARGTAGADYTVGGYDVLSIAVYEEEDLSREAVRVSGDGYISFPLIGRLKVDGLTTSEIEKMISLLLAKEQYLLDAHLSVMVTEYNSKRFLVLGAAKNPGSYPLRARERVLDAISKAGGIDLAQAGKKGMIIRTENPNTEHERKIVINLDLQGLLKGSDQISNIFMAEKDTLFVPKAEHFYLIGQVQRPGSYPLAEKDISLVEAISMAGGFTQIAARNRSRIIRVDNGVEKIIEVRVDDITEAGKKIQDVLIQPDDVIVVPESFF
jgi:polysaccharide export outer membrane protein